VAITERKVQQNKKGRRERIKKDKIKKERNIGEKRIRLKEQGNKDYFILCSFRWTLHAQTRHTRKF
jgi:hypothetical protein